MPNELDAVVCNRSVAGSTALLCDEVVSQGGSTVFYFYVVVAHSKLLQLLRAVDGGTFETLDVKYCGAHATFLSATNEGGSVA